MTIAWGGGYYGVGGYRGAYSAGFSLPFVDPATTDPSSYTTAQIAEMTKLGINIAQEVTGTPYQRLEKAKADLIKAVVEGRPFSTIVEVQARLRAAEQAVAEYEATQASRWEWATLGKAALAVGIGIGVMVLAAQAAKGLR